MSEAQIMLDSIADPMEDPPLANRKKVKAKEKQVEVLLANRRATLRSFMETKHGRAWFWWYIGVCGPLVLPLSYPAQGVPIDVNATMFNIGKIAIGNLLIAELQESCPDRYLQMVTEAQEGLNV